MMDCNKDGLYSVVFMDYSSHAAATCMNRLSKLSARWTGDHGFSIEIDDVQCGDDLNTTQVESVLKGMKNLIISYSISVKGSSNCNLVVMLLRHLKHRSQVS